MLLTILYTCDSVLTSFNSLDNSAISLSKYVQNLSTLASRSASDLSIAFNTLLMEGVKVWRK